MATTALALLAVVAVPKYGFGDDVPATSLEASVAKSTRQYNDEVQPLLAKHCFGCHGADLQEADVRLDSLDPNMVAGHDAERWHAALDMINQGYMPPDYEEQPSDEERRLMVEWMTESLDLARKAKSNKPQPRVRRLTREQYTNSLAELLHLPLNFGKNLPAEAKSKMGFTNSGNALLTSGLHVEYYQAIARADLQKAIVAKTPPETFRYRVTVGKGVGAGRHAAVIGGFQSAPIARQNVLVEILDQHGQPRQPTSPDEQKQLRGIESNIGVGMRGSSGDRYQVLDEGLLLYSALPHREQAPKSWQGPSPNMKMLLRRCFPSEGPFVLRVVASLAEGDDDLQREGLIELRSSQPVVGLKADSDELASIENTIVLTATECTKQDQLVARGDYLVPQDVTKPSSAEFDFEVPETGYYHIDFLHPPASADAMPSVSLTIDKSAQHLRVEPTAGDGEQVSITPLSHAYLTAGTHHLTLGGKFFVGFREVAISPLPSDHPASAAIEQERATAREQTLSQSAALRAFVGNRTDDGMEYAELGAPQVVANASDQPATFEFHGYLEDLPTPILDLSEKTSLSNIMIVGVWNDHLAKNPSDRGVPVVVKSIEFAGPYYPEWPPKSHTEIFFDSPLRDSNPEAYTREVLERFMTRAFRREVSDAEIERYVEFWQATRGDFDRYEDGVREVLVAVLCSPHFLYLEMPARQESGEAALAERLAYFLWNSPPDEQLAKLAQAGDLRKQVAEQVERMIADERINHFIDAFTDEWLRLDRHAAMSVNIGAYPDYTRFVKRDMALETSHFVRHVLQNNMSLMTFVESDFAMLNQNLAEFYGIQGVEGNHFRPVSVTPDMHRGGLLSQGAFLTGHSDGTQAHPIKRAVWVKAKILGSPPPPPPPNVPELDPETPGFQNLTLKEQLELHRSKPSCKDCHSKFDPFGVVFENYDAVGRFQTMAKGRPVDARTELPDGETIDGVDQLKTYLLGKRGADVTRSVVSHLYAYATGRDVTFADQPQIDSITSQVIEDDYRIQTAVLGVIRSPAFWQESLTGDLAQLSEAVPSPKEKR
nr:DUF1592 domain-containing protein [Aeoliella straminimaris]